MVNKKIVKDYIAAKKIATIYGIVNRLTLTRFIEDSLKENFNNAKISILIDLNHDTLMQEKINNSFYYVHRYRANRTYTKDLIKNHKLFNKTGQLLMIPGLMGDYSYIGVLDEGAKNTFYSANHGAGGVLDKVEARNKFDMADLNKEMTKFNVKLYRYNVANIVEEIP